MDFYYVTSTPEYRLRVRLLPQCVSLWLGRDGCVIWGVWGSRGHLSPSVGKQLHAQWKQRRWEDDGMGGWLWSVYGSLMYCVYRPHKGKSETNMNTHTHMPCACVFRTITHSWGPQMMTVTVLKKEKQRHKQMDDSPSRLCENVLFKAQSRTKICATSDSRGTKRGPPVCMVPPSFWCHPGFVLVYWILMKAVGS